MRAAGECGGEAGAAELWCGEPRIAPRRGGLVALLCPTWPTVAAGLIGSALVAGHSSAVTARLTAALMQFTLFFVGIALAVMAAGHQLSELLDIAAPAWPFAGGRPARDDRDHGVLLLPALRHAASIIALQVYLGGEVSPALGGLVSAVVASVGAQALSRVGPPWHVTYLPTFMIVALGSFASMTASQVSGYSASPLVSAGSAFLGVAVGTLLGGALKELEFSKTLARGVRRRRA